MIISEALRLAQQLEHSDSARLDAEVLLAAVLDKTRTYLYTWPQYRLTPSQQALYCQWMQRRARGEPVAYITGYREFWSLPLEVNSSTLIPRPDTELLVERALAILAEVELTEPRILDLGTGTGAIALALGRELPGANIVAIDANIDAVELAKRNAMRLGIANVAVGQSDWFESVRGTFDMIVANPPYIDAEDDHLQQRELRFEPSSALVAAEHGLADLALICQEAPLF